MKQVLAYFILFTIICAFGNFAIDYSLGQQIDKQSPYYLAFTSIGANSLESRLDSWVKIKTKLTEQEISFYMQTIIKALDLPPDQKWVEKKDEQDNFNLSYNWEDNDESCQITILSNHHENETAIVVNIISTARQDKMQKASKSLDQILGLNWSHYYAYTGVLSAVIEQSSQEKLLSVILKNLDASQIEFYQDDRLVMVTGYSSILLAGLKAAQADGKKYNVQAAMRTDLQEQKTYIYLGVPLMLNNL